MYAQRVWYVSFLLYSSPVEPAAANAASTFARATSTNAIWGSASDDCGLSTSRAAEATFSVARINCLRKKGSYLACGSS